MDKLRQSTVTPSKKRKQEINFKSKVKKLIIKKKITKNGDIFVQGAFKTTNKGPEIKILSDVTTLLLKNVENKEVPVSVDRIKCGDVAAKLETGNQPEMILSSTQDLKDQQTECNVLNGEKLKDDAVSKEEIQNPEIVKIRLTQEKKTEMSAVVKNETENGGTTEVVVMQADGQKCLKIEKASKNLAHIEVSREPEICVMGLTKEEKRMKKKLKDNKADSVSGGEGKFGEGRDSGSCLSNSGKGAINGMGSNKEQRREGGTLLERKSDMGISQDFQVSDLSSDKSERHGKEVFGRRRISGSRLSDTGKGATNGMGTNKKWRRTGGIILARNSDMGISQGFQVSDLLPDKSERHEEEVFGGRRDSGSRLSDSGKGATNSMSGNKEQRRAGGTMLARKSDMGISQGFQVSDLSSDKSERHGKEAFGRRRISGSRLSDTGKSSTNGMGTNKEQRRTVGTMLSRKSDMGISQGFQVSDLSPDKSEIPNSSTTSLSKDTKAHKKWRTSADSNSGDLGKLIVNRKLDKPKPKGSSKRNTNSDYEVENNESEMEQVSATFTVSQVLRSIRKEPEVLGANIGMNTRQKLKKEEQNCNEKNVLRSKVPIDFEEGCHTTWETEIMTEKEQLMLSHKDTNTLVSNCETRKVPKKGKVCDTGNNNRLEPDGEQSEEVWNFDSNGTDSEEENNSTLVRKEACLTLSMETKGPPNWISNRLQLMQEQEVQEQSYVCLKGFTQYKSSRPSECEVVELENKFNMQFYCVSDNRYVLLLKQSSVVYFHGKLTLTVLAGCIEILGCVLQRRNEGHGQSRVSVFSPRGSSLLALEVLDFAERKDCKEVAVEAVSSFGMQKCDVCKIEDNYEEGDCLLLLEVATSFLYTYLSQNMPEQLIPNVAETVILHNKYCIKELQCTFYLPNYTKNVRTFVKNEKWEQIVLRILNQDSVECAASCTMLCGGKGVGKSTLLRYLVNKALLKHSRVLCLDFDPGQAEFTVPGCLSAVLVNQPLLGPNYTHLTVPEKSVYLGHIDVSQCPTLYLEAVNHIISFCRDNPEFFGIPWFVNTMGFCKGLGVELTNTVIQMVRPTDLVQIQSQTKHRNFPKMLKPYIVANYQSPFRYIPHSQVTVDYQFHLIESSAESKIEGQETEWGYDARKLRDIVILSYLSQLVKPPEFSLTEIVPYMTNFSNLKLRICHELVRPNNVLCVLNGCMVALCCTDNEAYLQPSEPDLPCVFQQTPVCDCLGFGVIRGVDMNTKKLFLITPIPAEHLRQVNCLVMGTVQLPTCVILNPVGSVGHIPYVTVGPGQLTGRSSRKRFTRHLLAGTL